LKIEDEARPVILDLESVRVLGNGKFEIDIVSLMNRRPIVFKLSEGKYLIDIEGM
jgi:predicted  nucleic acid-binding Zn-ribbon protein